MQAWHRRALGTNRARMGHALVQSSQPSRDTSIHCKCVFPCPHFPFTNSRQLFNDKTSPHFLRTADSHSHTGCVISAQEACVHAWQHLATAHVSKIIYYVKRTLPPAGSSRPGRLWRRLEGCASPLPSARARCSATSRPLGAPVPSPGGHSTHLPRPVLPRTDPDSSALPSALLSSPRRLRASLPSPPPHSRFPSLSPRRHCPSPLDFIKTTNKAGNARNLRVEAWGLSFATLPLHFGQSHWA